MRKLSVFVFALVLFTIGANVVSAALADDSFPVKVRLLEYAYLEVPEILDIGEVDFYEGFDKYEVWTTIKLFTNTNVLIRFESAGFNFEGEGLNPVGYHYKLQHYTYQTQSFASGGWRGGWSPDDSLFKWTGDVILIPFAARVNNSVTPENFYKIKAGEYNDIITLTVSAYHSE